MSLRRLSRPLGLVLSGLLATAALALVPASAQARIAAPSGLAPKGASSSSTPTFTWGRVSGAVQYDLQLLSNDNVVLSASTANNKWVSTSNLQDGSYTWQVRADTTSGSSSWASADLSISSSAAPTPISPVGGATLTQPDSPPLFKWSPVASAVGYDIQVTSTGSFTAGPSLYSDSTNATSYIVTSPQATGTWYWRVRANRGNGFYTGWSDPATYVVGQLADPVTGSDMSSTPVQDVTIDWNPVAGATQYQLQVGKDPDFNNIIDTRLVMGTRYQPGNTYNNSQYYWRVRAIDAAGNYMPWTSATPNVLQRNWPQAPQLEWPPNQLAPAVKDPMYFQWKPVPHASSYQLDISADPNFSPGQYFTCSTTGTTYLIGSPPGNANSCGGLSQGQTFYWRVRAIDDPTGVLGIYSSINKFVYDTGRVAQTSPVDGATVDVPTLSWSPTRETNQYEVVVKDKNGSVVASVDTYSTSWTPSAKLDPSGGPYTWTVVSIDASGVKSPLYSGMSFNTSGNDPTYGGEDPLTQMTGTGTSGDFPSLSWVPVSGADYYMVTIGVHGSNHFDLPGSSYITAGHFQYPAATDTLTRYLTPGQYDWYVTAYTSTGGVLASSNNLATFTIADLPAASGQRVTLGGLASQDGVGCTNTLSAPQPANQICTGVPTTPILSWDSTPGAAGYMVYLANDQSLTNLVTPAAVTTNTMWRPPGELADNTAQGSYFWFVRPCKSVSPLICNPDPTSLQSSATNAFRKQSAPVALQTPGNGSTVTAAPTNAPLFTWTDYLNTNQQAANAYDGVANDASYQAARTYRVQISQKSDFTTLLDDRQIDQPFYSPSDLTLPQGTIYWRVQATDGSGNHLTWSNTYSFSNNLPAVDLSANGPASPVGGVNVSGSTPFQWASMNGASSYTLEVYRNDSGTHSPGNLVFSQTTREPTYVWNRFLPPSGNYTWRVMWTDAGGQQRPWSVDGHFTVNSSALTLTSPPTGTRQTFNDLYFTWNQVPLAASYYLDVRDSSNRGVINTNTTATAYAPSTIGDGSFTWRVTALDPNGGNMATSAWRTFTVDATRPVVTKVTPAPYGKPTSHLTVTFSEKVIGVTASTFVLHPYGKKSKLGAKVKLSSSGRVATLTPKAKLKKGRAYTGTVTGTIHDAAGNHLVTYSWSFSV